MSTTPSPLQSRALADGGVLSKPFPALMRTVPITSDSPYARASGAGALDSTTTGSPVYSTHAPPSVNIGTVANAPPPVRGTLSPFDPIISNLSTPVTIPGTGMGIDLWVILAIVVGVVLLLLVVT